MASPNSSDRSRAVVVRHHRDGASSATGDVVATEEPLEIRLGGEPLAVVMRTPGDDDDLIRGFLLTEGILLSLEEVSGIERLDESRYDVRLAAGVDIDVAQFARNMFLSSSCGVCGKRSIEVVHLVARPRPPFRIASAVVDRLTNELRKAQPTFDATGGLHAAGLYTPAGRCVAVREDVGRHNAVDKAIGTVAASTWPLPPLVLVVSGRQSFEIVQKAAVAGIGAIVGVSAPSSLAVDLASSLDMLLIGFARGDGFNVYSGETAIDG